jgi:uncharacterized damage-inducible protein DinB
MSIGDIISTLENVYAGPTWYGKNIKETLKDLPIGKALLRLQGSYNIAELIHHMIAWRNYVIKLVETGKHHKVPDVENFPTIEVLMMDEWNELMHQFDQSQIRLLGVLQNHEVDLNAKVPDKAYSFQDVLVGIIHHDIYHAGQLNLLAKFL